MHLQPTAFVCLTMSESSRATASGVAAHRSTYARCCLDRRRERAKTACPCEGLELEFRTPVDGDEFRSLPGVTEVKTDGHTVTVGFEGSADAVVKAAAAHEVLAIRPREEDLEDIFLRYYQADPTP
jgi:hypothetical protein